jgi:transcriptional antiterminator RfaH
MSQAVKHWYPVYTRARNEKKVADLLERDGVECYLPLKKVLRQWSDRKKWVQMPLFSSYVFVRIDMSDYYAVLNTPGVARFIFFEGKAVSIPDRQVETIRILLTGDLEMEAVEEQIEKGDKVLIDYGAMKGIEGELTEFQGRKRVVIRIDEIGKNLVVTVPLSHIRKIQIH